MFFVSGKRDRRQLKVPSTAVGIVSHREHRGGCNYPYSVQLATRRAFRSVGSPLASHNGVSHILWALRRQEHVVHDHHTRWTRIWPLLQRMCNSLDLQNAWHMTFSGSWHRTRRDREVSSTDQRNVPCRWSIWWSAPEVEKQIGRHRKYIDKKNCVRRIHSKSCGLADEYSLQTVSRRPSLSIHPNGLGGKLCHVRGYAYGVRPRYRPFGLHD